MNYTGISYSSLVLAVLAYVLNNINICGYKTTVRC